MGHASLPVKKRVEFSATSVRGTIGSITGTKERDSNVISKGRGAIRTSEGKDPKEDHPMKKKNFSGDVRYTYANILKKVKFK